VDASQASSPTIRGDPQRGFALDICRMGSRIALLRAGLPDARRESRAQWSRNLRRCQPMTVLGRTKTRTSSQPAHIRDSHAHRRPSAGGSALDGGLAGRRRAGGAGRALQAGARPACAKPARREARRATRTAFMKELETTPSAAPTLRRVAFVIPVASTFSGRTGRGIRRAPCPEGANFVPDAGSCSNPPSSAGRMWWML
jgi:hypothetical protein